MNNKTSQTIEGEINVLRQRKVTVQGQEKFATDVTIGDKTISYLDAPQLHTGSYVHATYYENGKYLNGLSLKVLIPQSRAHPVTISEEQVLTDVEKDVKKAKKYPILEKLGNTATQRMCLFAALKIVRQQYPQGMQVPADTLIEEAIELINEIIDVTE